MIKGHLKLLLKGKDNDFVYKFGEAHDSDLEKILMSYKKKKKKVFHFIHHSCLANIMDEFMLLTIGTNSNKKLKKKDPIYIEAVNQRFLV